MRILLPCRLSGESPLLTPALRPDWEAGFPGTATSLLRCSDPSCLCGEGARFLLSLNLWPFPVFSHPNFNPFQIPFTRTGLPRAWHWVGTVRAEKSARALPCEAWLHRTPSVPSQRPQSCQTKTHRGKKNASSRSWLLKMIPASFICGKE